VKYSAAVLALIAAVGLSACSSGQPQASRPNHAPHSQAVLAGCNSVTCRTDFGLLLARTALPGNSPSGEAPDTWCVQQIIQIGMTGQMKLYHGGTGATFRQACLLAAKQAEH